ncbi:tripartite tricarboxylate transporter TctB family protein [Halomonas alkaliantarctica]|uniref:Tripartite tricarboxylate transporter TctB family protein n=1 Tax=Halomonas alkaliantarctica TaxID=232346 RepID=A0ABY8LPE2_9GAMM|nr:tripartite tricarboxylate transporter TctB family protein [Halomonas alkaliantarctica]WGI26290.1 tripartite tricarboxylate transporter TctB family protein [Halomonas alkaliantarctica]
MAKDIGKPIFDLFLVVVSAIGFYMATTLPAVSMAGGLSPASFPKLISGLIFVCAVPCLIRDSYEWLVARRVQEGATALNATAPKKGILQWLTIVALIIVYINFFERLGYIASTTIFCFLNVVFLVITSGEFQKLSNKRKLRNLAAYTVFAFALSLVIYYVFTELFNIPLPD